MTFAYQRKKRLPFSVSSKDLRRSARGLKKRGRAIFFWGILILFGGGLIYVLIFSPYFKISEVSAESGDAALTQEVEQFIRGFLKEKNWRVVPRDNFFIFSSTKIQEELAEKFPAARQIQVNKFFPKKVKIIIEKREPAAIFCQCLSAQPFVATSTVSTLPPADQCFYVDQEGLIYENAPEISGTFLLTFYRARSEPFVLGEGAAASSTIKFVSDLKKDLHGRGLEMSAFAMSDATGQEISGFSSEGWVAYFAGNRPATAQAKVLEALLADEIKERRASLKYVDLRLPNRAYYQ